MITPQKIQELSEPVESIYTACVNELMVNIGKHITAPTWTHTAAWEVQKLSEMGQLTQENAAIINKWIKQVTPEMRKTMEFTRREALKKLEKQMEKAAEEGYVTPPLADSTVQVMNDYLGQATDRLNLVNTTMLQSSISQYSKAVNLTADIMARESATLTALNVAAGSVVTGTETRTNAVRRAIDTISKEGITGFYDRSGRSWTPEAYVNMVVRTTVHNTAIQSVKSRMQDYGTDVFQISSHAGARPRCYPYQGWFCSWSNTSGDIELGDGRMVRYRPLSDTSYGEPAGIFGINCGHYPIPIIAGLTIPHGEDNIQPKEENDKAYAESQQQRALERQIRAAKRTIEMGDNSPEAKQKLKEQQQKMRQFIKETGRTRRYDRESLMGGAQASQALNKNVNSNLTNSAKTTVKYGDAINGISPQYKAGAQNILDNAPENIKAAWNATSGDMLAPQFDIKRGAHYSPMDRHTHFENEEKAYGKSSYQEGYACFFHEYGHNIDRLLGQRAGQLYYSLTHKGGSFGKTIYEECGKRIKEFWYGKYGVDDYDVIASVQSGEYGMGMGAYVRSMLRKVMPKEDYRAVRRELLDAGDDATVLKPYFNKYLANEEAVQSDVRSALKDKQVGKEFVDAVNAKYTIYERTDISDMFDKYMRKNYGIDYPFGVGHDKGYWGGVGDYDSLAKEAFAEMFSATATGNKSLGAIKTMFPESYSMFEEMIGGATP